MKHKLGILSNCIGDEDTLLTLERIKKAGFDTIHVGIPDIDASVEIKKRADELGLETEFIHAPYKGINDMWANDDSVPEIFLQLKHSVDMARASGIPAIITHVSSGWDAPDICDKGLARFDALVDYAEENGVIIAFENLRKIGNLAYLVDRYEKRDNVRYCYDSGHEYGYTRFVSFPDIFREKLIFTHIHDNLGYEHNPESPDLHLLPFDGSMNYRDMMKRLHKYSYSGSIMLEVANHWCKGKYAHMSPDAFLKECYKRAKKISKM